MATFPGPRAKEAVARGVLTVLPSTALPAPLWAASRADSSYGESASPDWREIDWREHVHDLEIDGRRVRYADIGEGSAPPVVFVHGLGGVWQNWLESMPRVAEDRRALALDLPGFGASEMPSDDISISGYAEAVDALCDHLGLGQVALVGNSLGGFVAAELAIAFQKRVERLALVAAAGISITNLRRGPAVTAGRINSVTLARAIARRKDVIMRPRLRHAALSLVIRYPTQIPADLLYETVQGIDRPGFMPAMEALLSYDFRDRLPEIACPTLIVWGGKDMLVPRRDADEFERLVSDARKVVFEDTNHMPMIERPKAFNECLMEFLAEVPGEQQPGSSDSVDAGDAAADDRGEPAAA